MDDLAVESWDDEFEGNFHALAAHSTGTSHTAHSSRMSVASESLAGADDDWNLVLQPDDEHSTHRALASAQAAGVPIPVNVPQSALLGGTIRRLGGKRKGKQRMDDDWDGDIEMPDGASLQLKLAQPAAEEHDDFEELEGSLGIRFAGTRREMRNRSSSASAMSPSLGSVTAESEDDDLRGLELPDGPMDLDAMLKKRRAADAELSDLSQPSPALEQPAFKNTHKKSKLLSNDNDDYLQDFDLGVGGVLDSRLRNLNKNIKVKTTTKPAAPALRPATTINFHDKPTDRPLHATRSHIPRPVSGSKPSVSRLEPVMEAGASRMSRERRQPTTTSSQLLKSKRSLPALRSQGPSITTNKPPVPFLPSGMSNGQHGALHRPMPYHLRRDSDPHRGGAQSPPPRSHSRLSNAYVPDTPSRTSRQRPDVAPSALAREAAAKRTITKPTRRRNYGDGNELEIFDDLPTSMTKESRFVKQPVARGPPKPSLRQTQSRTDMREPLRRNLPERMMTPAPRTPASPTKGFYDAPSHTPSYLRDTASSRIARETRLGNNNPRPRSEGPLMPLSTNWKAQIAARSPHTSPSAQRQKTRAKQPQLIKGIGAHVPKTEKGMVYNPDTLRWEGNENTLSHFDLLAGAPLETPTPTGAHHPQTSYLDRPSHRHHHSGPPSSPPRPALIAPMSAAAAQGVQVNGGMVFDPRQMKWLKLKPNLGRDPSGPISPSITDGDGDDDEDAFAGIEDLKDDLAVGGAGGFASPVSLSGAGGITGTSTTTGAAAAAPGVGDVHEEFDLGPRFIEMQQTEEAVWTRRCAAWFPPFLSSGGGGGNEPRVDDGAWRWAIRDIARSFPDGGGSGGGGEVWV